MVHGIEDSTVISACWAVDRTVNERSLTSFLGRRGHSVTDSTVIDLVVVWRRFVRRIRKE